MTRALASDFQNPPTIVQYFFIELSYFGIDLEQSIKWRESVMLWMLYGSFQKHIMWPSIKEQFSHFSPQKKIMSFICKLVTQLQGSIFLRYLIRFTLIWSDLKHGTVMGSNICEWIKYLWMDQNFSLTLLCLQTRQSLFWT